MTDWQLTMDRFIDGLDSRLRDIRRYLHANPEPSGEEFETAGYLAQLLSDAKLRAVMTPSRRGLIVEPGDQSDAPRVAIRGDTDALRIGDEKDVEYRSNVDGVAHACGHDAHATMIVGAALALEGCRKTLPWPVTWRALFQPAEETSQGAKEIVEAGGVDNVRAIIGLHVDPERGLGHVGFRHGTLTAYCDEINVTVHGRSGHAARPHYAVDPIAAGVQFLSAVYQTLPRTVDSREPLVITFGSIHAGVARNVIPSTLSLRGTARTHSVEARDLLERRIEAVAHGVSVATGTEIELAFEPGPDAVVNDSRVTTICEAVAASVVGADRIEDIEKPSMGGEDFADYLSQVPGCFFRLGIADGEVPAVPLHSGRFDLDERALIVGVKILARAVVMLSEPGAL